MSRPTRRLAFGATGLVVIGIACCAGLITTYVVGGFAKGGDNGGAYVPAACGQDATVNPDEKLPPVGSLSQDQLHNSAIIIAVGQQMNVPPRGWVIAVATALQESDLHNLPNLGARNDHDSLGLFQQRPSQGWGTPQQILDPTYASTKFYQRLLKVRGWQTLPLTVAAQDVQHSAFPNAYAKHEPLATEIVNTLADGAARSGVLPVNRPTVTTSGAGAAPATVECASDGAVTASGWTAPVIGARITSGFRTADRPTHNGVDLAVPRGTVIHAASAGVVTVVACQASTSSGEPYSCNKDGSLAISGCGWYVEIQHAGNVITRYCHMLSPPLVTVGEQVAAGTPIGHVGMSGHATGPHCHFEVHLGGDRTAAGAVDPVAFMAQQGVQLTERS